MNLNPLTWNWNEQKSAGRHVLNTTATVIGTLAALHFLTPKDAGDITQNLNTIWDGVVKIGEGVGGLIAILTPIYTTFKAAHSASPGEEIKSVTSLPSQVVKDAVGQIPDTESRNKLINGVSKMGEVRAIVGPESLARGTESEKVVSTPAAAQQLPLAVPRAA